MLSLCYITSKHGFSFNCYDSQIFLSTRYNKALVN